MAQVAALFRTLPLEDGHPNGSSDADQRSYATFLDALERAASSVKAPMASRLYRQAFTINYRTLFHSQSRSYRIDVLEAGLDDSGTIWVNGSKFEFCQRTMQSAHSLARAWQVLSTLLSHWQGRGAQGATEVCEVFGTFDEAMSNFERSYIEELMAIEQGAKVLVSRAAELDKRLLDMEGNVALSAKAATIASLQSHASYPREQGRFVESVSKLNSVANFRRKGRDDLRADILVDALTALQPPDTVASGDARRAATVLATDVLQSYEYVRQYLREAGGCLERVDPHLSNNTELVERLVDWEESWEVASRYVQKPALLRAICDLVAEFRVLQRIAPDFKGMCEDCDVELFLVLPRIVWLWFLRKPDTRAELLRSLLPHRFGGENAAGDACDAEVAALQGKFCEVNKLLMESSRTCHPPAHFWEFLVRRVVKGSSTAADFDDIVPERVATAQTTTEGLMRDLEKWSMELQRHCPDDWNQTSAILLQCLEGTMGKSRNLVDDSCQVASLKSNDSCPVASI